MQFELIWVIIAIVLVVVIYFVIQKLLKHNKDTENELLNSQEIIYLQQEIFKIKEEFLQEKLRLDESFRVQLEQKQQCIASLEQQIIRQQYDFENQKQIEIKEAQKKSSNAQRSVIKGQIVERFVPFMKGFGYNASDCRFLGEPIDYVVFHGVHECADGLVSLDEVKIIFLEIKTGSAKINKRQEIIKNAIAKGQIGFETLRVDDNNLTVNIDKTKSVSLNIQDIDNDQDDDVNRVGQKWTTEEEERLIQSFDVGLSIEDIANLHQRKVGGIRRRLRKLGKIE